MRGGAARIPISEILPGPISGPTEDLAFGSQNVVGVYREAIFCQPLEDMMQFTSSIMAQRQPRA